MCSCCWRQAITPGKGKEAVEGLPGVEIGIVRCPPQTGPGLHNHQRTYETFICLDGEFDVMWSENATFAVRLKP